MLMYCWLNISDLFMVNKSRDQNIRSQKEKTIAMPNVETLQNLMTSFDSNNSLDLGIPFKETPVKVVSKGISHHKTVTKY